MKKFKGYSMTWWITEIVGLALLVATIIFEIAINFSLFTNSSVTISQKATCVAGMLMICYGWSFFIYWLVQSSRKFIRKHTKTKNGYSKEKIALIKKQMEESVSHLHNEE